jgi:hypothetical protein
VSNHSSPPSPRKLAACRANIRHAHAANRRRYRFTAARRAALDAARQKRTSVMTPARWAAVRKAAEANRRNFRLTRARLAAMRANGRKMQAASVEKFRMTKHRQRADLANLQKAWAKKRPPESYARSRFNHLKHGLDVRTLDDTFKLLGEDPKEFEAHCRRFARVFAPANPAEEKIVRRLAEVVWRRLRLFQAQARWERDRLKYFFGHAPFVKPLGPELTRLRAHALIGLLLDRAGFNRHDQLLTAAMERQLRALLRLRTGGDPQFKLFTRETRAELKEFEEFDRDMTIYERLDSGDPEAWKIIKKFAAKRG